MQPDLGPVVYVSLKDIYDALLRLEAQVSTLVQQQATVAQDLREHEARADTRHDDHESRLRALERARWPLPSLAAVVSIAALVVAILPKL